MNEPKESSAEIRRLRRLLKQMYTLAEHASLTGALEGGAIDVVAQYNRILQRLEERDILSPTIGLFTALPPDASFDRVGVTSKLLEGYLADEDADRAHGKDDGEGSHKVIIGNLSAELSGLEELKDLGRMMRENLPDFLRHRGEPPVPPTPPTPPTPHAAATPPPLATDPLTEREGAILMPDMSGYSRA